ncbi:V-type ATP synthase subunit E [Ruminococcus sp.]|uniref:V-type ATP synthase subunit E n=1 Tax=Ruminococcus sp. TaxID=41978 RepID=UPI00386768C1
MSGIDKIIQEIETNTAQSCDSVLAQARQKADAIIADAQKQADQIVADGKDRTAAHVADIKKRGDSAAELEEKRVMLVTKQQIINTMLQEGLATAKSLPKDEYFALIKSMVAKYSMEDDGVIFFGEKDNHRLPVDFLSELNQAAKGGIVLSSKPAPIDAGFILKYGGIEQNCSFDAIFAGEAEELCDKAGRLLF